MGEVVGLGQTGRGEGRGRDGRSGPSFPDSATPRAGRIRTSEVLRYLGHAGQEVNSELAARIEAGIELAERTCEPRWLWREFEVVSDEGRATSPQEAPARRPVQGHAPGGCAGDARGASEARPAAMPQLPAVRLAGTSLALEGRAMADFLAGAGRVALFACTLGAAADRQLRRLGVSDPLGQLIFDAACTDLVEWGADRACEEIAAQAAREGLVAGERFSPGYADLPIEVQPAFLEVLQAPKCLGLTASASNLLVPTKSVTCVVGLYPSEPAHGVHLGCGACNIWQTCQLRLRGTPCWRRG